MKSLFRILVIVLARRNRLTYLPWMVILLCQWASAATYYVAPTGNDSNVGTIAAPFLTIQQGANRAVAGDTLIVRDGTYGHVNSVTGGDSSGNAYSPVVLYNSGTAAAWITIMAEHKGAAVLDCEMLCDSYINLYNASYIVIQDLVITRGYKEDGMLNYSLPLNQWQHVVFTFSSGIVHGYVNGSPVAFAANTFTAGTALPLQMYGLFIGTDSSKTDFYKGYMDDVRIYDRALTGADVATLYSTTRH